MATVVAVGTPGIVLVITASVVVLDSITSSSTS